MTVDQPDACALCVEGGRDPGLPMPGPYFHPECGLRSALGGIGHLTDHDHWCLTEHDPDMGLSFRESALRVAEWVREHSIEDAAAIGSGARRERR